MMFLKTIAVQSRDVSIFMYSIVVEADGSSFVCLIKVTLMAALPRFCLNKTQKIHDVSGIYYVPLQMLHSYKKFLVIIINNKITYLKLLDAIFVKITYKKRVVNNM